MNFDPAAVQVRAHARWNSIRELLYDVKANPGRYKASGTGKGGIWDVARAGMLKAAGLPVDAIPWVPSEGAAPALQELVAGGTDIVTASLPEGAPMISAGRVKPLAIMAEKRDPLFPIVPTLRELGIDWVMGAWRGFGLPKGASAERVAFYERAIRKVYESSEFKNFMETNGFGMVWRGSQEFASFMEQQDQTMGQLMRELGLAK